MVTIFGKSTLRTLGELRGNFGTRFNSFVRTRGRGAVLLWKVYPRSSLEIWKWACRPYKDRARLHYEHRGEIWGGKLQILGDNTDPRNILESKKLFLPSKFPRLSPEIWRHSLAVREYRQCNALIALQMQTTTPIFSLEFPFHFVLGTCCGQE